MPQAYVDPEELEKFARNLKQFNTELRNSTSHLQGQFAKLDDVWRDQEHARFAQEFQQTLGNLRSFMFTSDAFISFLLAACRREQRSSHGSRQTSVRIVHGTGRSARMERGRT